MVSSINAGIMIIPISWCLCLTKVIPFRGSTMILQWQSGVHLFRFILRKLSHSFILIHIRNGHDSNDIAAEVLIFQALQLCIDLKQS